MGKLREIREVGKNRMIQGSSGTLEKRGVIKGHGDQSVRLWEVVKIRRIGGTRESRGNIGESRKVGELGKPREVRKAGDHFWEVQRM